jgi:alpha-tubulin suppressor-like RCC1 family protein
MSQEKAQLIAPIGIMTVSGLTATGVITATSFTGDVVGSAKSLVNGTDVTAGVVTGTSFVGNLTGNIQRLADSAPNINVGVTTATSFVGNLTGSVTDLTSQPAITVGLVTATSLSGPITGNVTGDVDGDVTGNVTGTIAGNVTGNVTGNATGTSGGLGVNYNGGWTGAGTSQVRVGVITATYFHGDGSNLDGVSSGPVSQQAVTIDGASTSIDLSSGNVIYATQSADTTVSFANTENGNVYFIRTKDDTSTARTITWPTGIGWSGGSAPTLIQDNPRTTDAQVFLLVTRDMGVTWYGKEVMRSDPQTFSLFSWGRNDYAQQGHNDKTERSSPTQVPGTNWKSVSVQGTTRFMALAQKSDNTLWAWGDNDNGKQAQNSTVEYSSPIQIGTDTDWSGAFMNGQAAWYAVKTDGTLWTCGGNGSAALGQNDKTSRSSPVQISGTTWSTNIDHLGAGTNAGFAIKTDGTLWSWGYNNYGGLGQNNRTEYSSPRQIPGTTWNFVESNGNSTIAVKTDGTMWSWGNGIWGMLGLNQPSPTKLSSPTQVGTDTTWKSGSIGDNNMLATKTNGTLWMWGVNQAGNLGLNEGYPTRNAASSPVQIPGTTWETVRNKSETGGEHTLALKTDGTLWTWGDNENGDLGLNSSNPDKRSSPTQITGTWSKVDAGSGHSFALQSTS